MTMTHKERFNALFSKKKIDRCPVYFFGTWTETKQRWVKEGFNGKVDFIADAGPQVVEMDPDWEYGMWNCHGLINYAPIGDMDEKIIHEDSNYIIKQNSIGEISKTSKKGDMVDCILEYALKPDRKSWNKFKTYLNSDDKRRYPENLEQKAKEIGKIDMVHSLFGGSLYGLLRNWMGIENLSLLMYDDEKLLRDMLSYLTDFYITLTAPVLKLIDFNFVYIFEDCCGANGPLFSPVIYDRVFDEYYRKLIRHYKSNGIKFVLLDSDGYVDIMVPHWLKSGVDIIFPVEVGKWGSTPITLNEKFGDSLKMMGGVDKHLISTGGDKLKDHLKSLKPLVDKGVLLPIPDHRIPPECSYDQFLSYIKVFREIFG